MSGKFGRRRGHLPARPHRPRDTHSSFRGHTQSTTAAARCTTTMDVASSYTADVDHLDDDGASVLPREDFKRGLAPVESDLSEPSEPVIKLSPSAVQPSWLHRIRSGEKLHDEVPTSYVIK